MSHCQPGTGEHTRHDQVIGTVGPWDVHWTIYCGYCHQPYRNYVTPRDGITEITSTGVMA